MKIAITGASGFLGRELAAFFHQNNVQTVLLGRDTEVLAEAYPTQITATYGDFQEAVFGCDTVLHLAVKNNDADGDLDAFRSVNVEFLKTMVRNSIAAGVQNFINISTLHVQDSGSAYGQSKAEGEAYLSTITDLKVTNLRLPAVYGADFRGKLAILNLMPEFMQGVALKCLACLKPVVSTKNVYDAVYDAANGETLSPPIITDRQAGNWMFSGLKRLTDLALSICVVVLLFWLMAIVAFLIRVTSPGPAIFKQERVGLNQRKFYCYKFRTMHVGTRQAGTHEVEASSITKVGKFIRKTKIDELPQVFNIFMNQMSLVGPRPGLPSQLELTAERIKKNVFVVKPGITGLSQIKGIDMSDPAVLARSDAEYLALRTNLLDFRIILATALGKGQGDKVK